MSVILYILFALYVCWTSMIITKMISIRLKGNKPIWNDAYRNLWCISTTVVILYFWFN